MDNVKKFEDFLGRMQGLLDEAKRQGHIIVRVEDLEKAFPELKESDDERIRKAILNYFTKCWGNCKDDVCDVHVEDAIAWLEKQGNPQARTGIEWLNTIDNACDKRYSEGYAHGEYCHEQSFKWGFQEGVEWLEKQGKKPQGKTALEAIKEEKVDNSNKIESKFNVGDWIVNEQGEIAHIIDMHKDCYGMERYYIEFLEGIKTDPIVCFVDEDFHLWTIQDAEDGDVLAAHECFVLFKKLDGLNIKCYCTYHYMNNPSFHVDTLQNKDAFHPATKSQRDTLFSKMKEAGYKWDAKRKELKRVEQNTEESACSEDERIRKAIIEFFESEGDNTTYSLIPKKDILAWLEKQGKKGGEE